MTDLKQLARDALAYEKEQITLHEWRKSVVLMQIDLLKHWGDWLESLVSYLQKHGAVKEVPGRFIISINKLQKAIIREPSIKDKPLLEEHYLKLRRLASHGQLARFGSGHGTIELVNPASGILRSFLPPEYECAVEPRQPDKPTAETTLEHKIGEVVRGADIKHANATDSFIWRACPICGKQEWASLSKNGRPRPKRCADCTLFKRPLPPRAPRRKVGAGYVLVRLESTDFFYPMANKHGYVMEHRLVIARHLQRCLHQWEIVHHKNGIKADNQLGNLELVASAGEHIANHNTGYTGGYNHGLYDGRDAQVQKLKARIAELEAERLEAIRR